MRMVITIKLDNAVFFPSPRPEVCRILRDLADKFETVTEPTAIMDLNGNSCGRIEYYK